MVKNLIKKAGKCLRDKGIELSLSVKIGDKQFETKNVKKPIYFLTERGEKYYGM